MYTLTFTMLLFFSLATFSQSLSSEEVRRLTSALNNNELDTTQIDILLRLANYHIHKPGEKANDLDSADNFIKKAEKVNAPIRSKRSSGNILLSKAYLLRERGQTEKAKEIARQAIDILKLEQDKLLAGEAWFEYSSYLDIYDPKQLRERIKLVDSAVACFQRSGNLERVGASLEMLGDLYQVEGAALIALHKLQLALDVYTAIHKNNVQGIYSLMGRIYSRQRDYKKALDYELLALKTAENVGDSSMMMCMINTDIGQTFSLLGENQKALVYQKKALSVAEKYNDIIAIYVTTSNIAITLNSLNRPRYALRTLDKLFKKYKKPQGMSVDYYVARAYIGSFTILKEYSRAEPYCNLLLHDIATADLSESDYSKLYAYAEVVKFYVNSSQYEKATKYLKLYTALAKKTSDLLQIANSQKLWFMLDTARHDYSSAIRHLLTYKSLSDSLFNETKSKQVSELQVQYETEKKEKDILVKDQNISLLTKQDMLQKSDLQKGVIIRNISFGIAGLLTIIIALLYNRYRMKQRTNERLGLQQEEIARKNLSLQHLLNEKEWLLKEIHHRVKNNLQVVMSLLNSQSAYIESEPALDAIHDSQHRVQAMSLIHQKLYNSENLSSIDMTNYIHELVSYLRDSFNTGQRILFECNLEPIELDVAQAVPMGLILNEAITNSIKYAFPNNARGKIQITLSPIQQDHWLLVISDNGIGLPSHFANKKPGSLGMSLMAGLTEDLDGTISIESRNGTSISISFERDLHPNRPSAATPSFVA